MSQPMIGAAKRYLMIWRRPVVYIHERTLRAAAIFATRLQLPLELRRQSFASHLHLADRICIQLDAALTATFLFWRAFLQYKMG
jgi:hypothetical protein